MTEISPLNNNPEFKLPRQLLKGLVKEEFLIIIGSGVSSAAKIISAQKLLEELYSELKADLKANGDEKKSLELEQDKTDLRKVSQCYQNYYRENKAKIKTHDLIAASSQTAEKEIFKILAKLPTCDIVTTNYDRMIESNQSGPNYRVIHEKDGVLNGIPHKSYSNIIKMHGDIEDFDSIVLTQTDYDDYDRKHPNIIKELIKRFEENSLLIIGYSANDDNFRRIFSPFRENFNKKIYWVDRNDSEFRQEAWPAVDFIKMDIYDFFSLLFEEIQRYQSQNPQQTMGIYSTKIESKTDTNPFKFYKTESIAPWDFTTVGKYFVEPVEFQRIIETGTNTIIEGDRGSGKSMMLRYISLETQLSLPDSISFKNDFLGFYIKMEPGLVSTAVRKNQDNEQWKTFFIHFFNLLISERIVEILKLCKRKSLLLVKPEAEKKFCEFIEFRLLDFQKSQSNDLEELLTFIRTDRERMATIDRRHIVTNRTSTRYSYELVEKLWDYNPIFSEKQIYFLCDEVDNLSSDQMKVFVLFLRSRDSPISYKICAKTDSLVLTDLDGKELQLTHDYEHVYCDRFVSEQRREVIEFFENLSNTRLKENKYQIQIRGLLPPNESDKYSGFENYCYLSSGIVRSYITLVKDTIYRANPEICEQRVDLIPIPPKRQSEVIKIKSNIHFTKYGNCEHPDEVKKFVEVFGSLFKEILKLSRDRVEKGLTKELRTVSQIEIKDYQQLDVRIKKYFDEAVIHNLLQIPLLARKQDVKTAPYHGYKLHRLLVPYFSLELPNRFPRTITATHINILNDVIKGIKTDSEFIDPIVKELTPSEEEKTVTVQMEFDSEEVIPNGS